jgi:hypothetical protein
LHHELSRKLRYSKLNDELENYKYNAFIAYHHDNYKWACGPLVTFLEEQKKLTLCLHDRDFVPGLLIVDNIFENQQSSHANREYQPECGCTFHG